MFCTDYKDPTSGNIRILVAGGTTVDNVKTDQVLFYDVTADPGTWQALPPLPSYIFGAAQSQSIMKFNDKTLAIYVMGSDLHQYDHDQSLVFDPSTTQWSFKTLQDPKITFGVLIR